MLAGFNTLVLAPYVRLPHSSTGRLMEDIDPAKCPFCILELQMVKCLARKRAVETPSGVLNLLEHIIPNFQEGSEQDAHEFMRSCLDRCEERSVKMYDRVHKNVRTAASSNGQMSKVSKGLKAEPKLQKCSGQTSVTRQDVVQVLGDGSKAVVAHTLTCACKAKFEWSDNRVPQTGQEGSKSSKTQPVIDCRVEEPRTLMKELFAGVNVTR